MTTETILNRIQAGDGLVDCDQCADGIHVPGRHGVESIVATGDGKVEFIVYADHIMAYVKSAMGYGAYYPVQWVQMEKPLKAVLMDLDGTSVHSEAFWIWIIQKTTSSLLGNPKFELEEADLPFVSGHSVSEHLQYCLEKYCPDKTVEEGRRFYFEHTRFEMNEIMEGRGRQDAFTPAPGLKPFLTRLKKEGIRIGLVTSGLYEKAWPEILSAFKQLDMGDPLEFYDAIITAGFPMQKGKGAGTLGELSPKPHPWLYAETARVGLGLSVEDRHHIIGLEDSGAGVCSVFLSGFSCIGMAGGNIEESGTKSLCDHFTQNFDEITEILFGQ